MASSFFSGLIRFPSAAVYFLYDLSPITVTIKEERRNFLHFITRLCAVLGGTFAMTGLLLAYKIVFLSYAAVRIGFNKKKWCMAFQVACRVCTLKRTNSNIG
jgi:hypothetical protein